MKTDFLGVDKLRIFVDKFDLAIFMLFIILVLPLNDVTHNKLGDLGIDYKANIFGGAKISVAVVWWATFALIFLAFVIFVLKRVWKRNTHNERLILGIDVLVGFIAMFGMILGALGTFMMTQKAPEYLMPFFTFAIPIIDMYHLSLFLILAPLLYFTVTE